MNNEKKQDLENSGLSPIQQELNDIDVDDLEKKPVKQKAKTKKQLQNEVDELKKQLNALSSSVDITDHIIKPITSGLFNEASKLFNYPFNETDELLKDNFDKSASKTFNYYIGSVDITPPVELGINLLAIVATAFMKGKKIKTTNKTDQHDNKPVITNDVNLSTGERS